MREVLIVRRGLPEEYYRFLRIFAIERGVDVIVDRRGSERRRAAAPVADDRRRQERRGPPPRTWESADYIVVRPEAPPATASAPTPTKPLGPPGRLRRLFRWRAD